MHKILSLLYFFLLFTGASATGFRTMVYQKLRSEEQQTESAAVLLSLTDDQYMALENTLTDEQMGAVEQILDAGTDTTTEQEDVHIEASEDGIENDLEEIETINPRCTRWKRRRGCSTRGRGLCAWDAKEDICSQTACSSITKRKVCQKICRWNRNRRSGTCEDLKQEGEPESKPTRLVCATIANSKEPKRRKRESCENAGCTWNSWLNLCKVGGRRNPKQEFIRNRPKLNQRS